MKSFVFWGVLLAMFFLALAYAVRGESIINYWLNYTARMRGTNSTLFRLQRGFVDNTPYVATFRVVAAIVAAVLLGAMIYLIVTGNRPFSTATLTPKPTLLKSRQVRRAIRHFVGT